MCSIENKSNKKNILPNYSSIANEHEYADEFGQITKTDADNFIKVGTDTETKSLRSGTFIQKDNSILHCSQPRSGVDIQGIADGLKKFPWLDKYMWKLIDKDKDEITKDAFTKPLRGFFIRAQKDAKIEKPIQTCLYIAKNEFSQNVHNIVILEENSEIHIIAGCTTSQHIKSGSHIGLSEFFIKKGATLRYTMIHDWGEDVYVRPKTVIHIEEGGVLISNYVCLKPVKSLVTNPITILEKNATATLNSILVAGKDSYMDVGSIVEFNGKGARAEIVSRAIVAGGTIISRGHLKGNVPGVKGHLECKGLILKKGLLHAVPEISGYTPEIEISHEAAVGKIDKREIEYLMARGLNEDDAISTIVRGFLNVNIDGLPKKLIKEMDQAVQETGKNIM